MFARGLFCAALVALASSASAELFVVSDGDEFYRYSIGAGHELLMTGGSITQLVAHDGALATLEDGIVRRAYGTEGAKIVIKGSELNWREDTTHVMSEITENDGAIIELHGYEFRGYVWDASSSGVDWMRYAIEALLLDGSHVRFAIDQKGFPDTRFNHHLELVVHAPTFQDPDRDWDFDLEDLNLIRNAFGSVNDEIDTNFDGLIDLADLNLVRNRFGDGFAYTPDLQLSGVISPLPDQVVPEPASYLLALIGLAALATRRARRGP